MIGYIVGAAVLVAVPFVYKSAKAALAPKVAKVEADLTSASAEVSKVKAEVASVEADVKKL